MMTAAHPDAELLSDYALGRLLDDELDAVAEHLEQCSDCQETLSSLKVADDTLIRGLGGEPPQTPFGDEPEYAAALAAIEQLRAGGAVEGTHGSGEATQNLDHSGTLRLAADVSLGTLRDYELLAPLGQGGMGTVFRARHLRLDRLVAVKVLPAERMRQPQAIARFHREMKAVGNLDHEAVEPHARSHGHGEAARPGPRASAC
jgi:hypothetical protein